MIDLCCFVKVCFHHQGKFLVWAQACLITKKSCLQFTLNYFLGMKKKGIGKSEIL